MLPRITALLMLFSAGCGAPELTELHDDVVPVTPEVLQATAGRSTFAAGTPTVLFLNFGGGAMQKGATDDPATNTSFFASGQVPPFQGDQAGVVNTFSQIFAPFNVQIVTTRPSGDYVMVMFGGTPADVGVQADPGVAGLAGLDCGNQMPRNIAFVFSQSITNLGYVGSNHTKTVAQAGAHEVGHTLGLPHSSAPCDLMSYAQCAQLKTFLDQTMPLQAGTAPDHSCGLSTMNSHQMVDNAVGAPAPTPPPPGPTPGDSTPPVVQITSPQSGAQLGTGVSVHASISDDQGVTLAELLVDGHVQANRAAPPYDFTVTLQPGPHTLAVRARDAAGNQGNTSISVTVGTSPAPPPTGPGQDTMAPTVTIHSPQTGSTVQPQLTVHAAANDDRVVTLVELLVDGHVQANALTPPYDLSVTLSPGLHQLEVRARDAAGNQGHATIAVSVPGAAGPGAPAPGLGATDPGLQGGCSMAGGSAPPPAALLLTLLLLGLRRRR